MKNQEKCLLCGRELAQPFNEHHLIPVSQGGTFEPKVNLHLICHNKIHSLFTEKELAKQYYSIELLQANDEMQKFIKWVRKKKPSYYDRNKKANRKRKKRK
jgi:hypothetical protein